MNGEMKAFLLGVTRSLVALAVVGATIGMIWTARQIPDPWWPAMVAVLSYLYQGQGGKAS